MNATPSKIAVAAANPVKSFPLKAMRVTIQFLR